MQTLPKVGPSGPQTVLGFDEDSGGPGSPDRSRWNTRAASFITAFIVIGVTVFTFVQLRPGLLFGPNLDVGGDNAAHVVAVYYFIHHLLPRGQIAGWDPQWFNGFPLYVFYFPLPALLIAALSLIFPYAVAFKLITVAGILTLPSAAYLFGRLAGFRRPMPALMAAAMLPFLFNSSYTIDGGNIASTLAGEFSFTLGLSLALTFLGVFAYALRTGRRAWLAALLFALCVLCHVVPALFAVGGAIVLLLLSNRRHRLWAAVAIGAVGALLAAFWLLPFAADLRYSSSMGYGRVGDVLGNLFPRSAEQAVQWLGVIGAIIAIQKRDRMAIALVVLAAGAVIAFTALPSGFVFNARWLPFWYLATALLAAYAAGAIGEFIFAASSRPALQMTATPLLGGIISTAVVAGYLGVLPFYSTPASAQSFVPAWTAWNYSGYQSKPGWAQFSRVVAMLERAAKIHGCGRLDYEYSPNTTNAFGSTLVPMSFPYWTGGCIDAAEGVYYESSSSNDFHFLDQAELSVAPSNPVVGIPYQSLNVDDGIRHLQLQGIRYFLANSPTVEQAADIDPDLVRIGSTAETGDVIDSSSSSGSLSTPHPTWVLYLIRNSPLVAPLHYQPVVETGLSKAAWQKMAINWYQQPADWAVPVVSSGPDSWPRETAGQLVGPGDGVPVGTTTVSRVVTGDESVSFDVSRTGVPILVKVPYFPNWHVSGAQGPFDATPNLMVVVPNAHHVVLTYGTTTADTLGKVASGLGVLGLIGLWRSAPLTSAPTPLPSDDPAGDAPGTAEPPLAPIGLEERLGGDGEGAPSEEEKEGQDREVGTSDGLE